MKDNKVNLKIEWEFEEFVKNKLGPNKIFIMELEVSTLHVKTRSSFCFNQLNLVRIKGNDQMVGLLEICNITSAHHLIKGEDYDRTR